MFDVDDVKIPLKAERFWDEHKNWADLAYLRLIEDILENGYLQPTRAKIDGKNVSALTVFGRQSRFPLYEGFPLLTTKRISFNNIVHELLWYLRGDTNIKYLEDNKVTIWREWADENGDLGPVYGKQLRRIEYSTWIKPLIKEQPEYIHITPFNKDIIPDYSNNKCGFVGRVLKAECGEFTVIKEIPPTKDFCHSKFVIKFNQTGYEKEVDYTAVQSKKVKDPWSQSVFGIGYYGDYDKNDPDYDLLVDVWRDMIRRCYYKKNSHYKSYGAKGIWVDHDWWCFANFQRDAKQLYNWCLKKDYPDEYSLDKDVLYSANFYSKKTCKWASKEEQHTNTSQITPFTAYDKNGNQHRFLSLGRMVKECGVNLGAIHRCLKGKLKTHHGWNNFQYINREGYVLRTTITDQLKLSLSILKHDKDNRRNVITLWNPSEIDKMALPPCHGNIIQFYVQENRLSTHMYQRSVDTFLGLSYNIASYALLTHILAYLTNLEVGELIISTGNTHVYTNHLDQVKEQLTRKPYPMPRLEIRPGISSIDDFVREDFKLVDYKYHPSIKGQVAI